MSLATRVAAVVTRIAQELRAHPGQLSGTTAERLAYAAARPGLVWYDTTLGFEVEYTGEKWRAAHPVVQRLFRSSVPAAVRTERKTVTFELARSLDGTRGWTGQLHNPSFASNGAMLVYSPGPASSDELTTVSFAYASLMADFSAASLLASVTGYPYVVQ